MNILLKIFLWCGLMGPKGMGFVVLFSLIWNRRFEGGVQDIVIIFCNLGS